MRPEFKSAIDEMRRDIAKHERAVADLKATVNKLCDLDAESPLYPAIIEHSRFASPRGAAKAHRGAPQLPLSSKRDTSKNRQSVRPFILNAMKDGQVWGTEQLKTAAIKQGAPGVDESTLRTVFHGTLLALRRAGQVEQADSPGMWRIVTNRVVPIKGVA